jgi:ribosome-associated protein
MVLAAAAASADKKAEDTRILELDKSDSGFTDFFLIMSGTNTRQVMAISDEIELRLKREFGTYPNAVEGRRLGEWVLMDYVDFVVHIFVAERRAYYDIERLRKSATSLDIDQLKIALTEKVATVRKSAAAKRVINVKAAAPAKKQAAKKKSSAQKAVLAKNAVEKRTKKS